MRFVVLLLVATGGTACLPVIVPPLRSDLGVPLDGPSNTTRLAVGAHTAGLARDDTPTLDVGGGWVGDLNEGEIIQQGGYMETGVIGPRAAFRPSVSLRGELTGRAGEEIEPTLRIRLAVEVAMNGAIGRGRGSSRCAVGTFAGDAGLGLFADVGHAWRDEDEWVATIGLFGRTPLFAGAILLLPGC